MPNRAILQAVSNRVHILHSNRERRIPQFGKVTLLVGIVRQLYHFCPPETSQNSTWSDHLRILQRSISETGILELYLVHWHQPVQQSILLRATPICNALHQEKDSLTNLIKYREFCFKPRASELLNLWIRSRLLPPKLIARERQNFKSCNTIRKGGWVLST